MKRIEKVKTAVDVVLWYFIVTTVLLLLHNIISNLVKGINIKVDTLGGPVFLTSNLLKVLGIGTAQFITAVIIIVSLTLISILLKKNVHVNNKSLIYMISGILLVLSGITSIISREVPDLLKFLISISTQGQEAMTSIPANLINTQIVPILISITFDVLQIGIGVWFMLVSSKKCKQLEENTNRIGKLKLAIDVAFLYFIIKTAISVSNMFISFLFVKGFSSGFNNLWSVILFCIPWINSTIIIVLLSVISRSLKNKSAIADKSLTYIIAGLMLITTIINNFIMHCDSLVHTLIPPRNVIIGFDQRLIAGTNILYIVLDIIQIGIGVYFILFSVRKEKQQVEEV